jgi:hypothetical protein
MLKHAVYFDLLGSLDEGGAEWRPTLAGLLVLRLVDWRLDGDASRIPADWTTIESIRRAVLDVNEGDPIRSTLLHVLDAICQDNIKRVEIARGLMRYGRALNLSGRWALSADVFATVDNIAGPEVDPRVVIEANIALGAALRRLGNWDASAHAYSRAAYIASTAGDEAGLLQAEVGVANTHIAHGNIPAAESLLDTVVEKARAGGFNAVLGLALHARATVTHQKGCFGEAVQLGYDALEATTDLTARDAILADIASAFAGMGMYDAARDSHMIVSVTSQSQWVRWQATLNLMELAAIDGQEKSFDDYARELGQAALDPRLRAYYLLYLGNGQQRFGWHSEAEASLIGAREFAAKNQLHQIEHDAATAIAELESGQRAKTSRPVVPYTDNVPDRVREIAAALSGAREAAVGSP